MAWTFAARNGGSFTGYQPPTVAADGRLYAAEVGMVHAISPSGQLDWSLELAGRPSGSPTIGGDGTIYFSMNALHAVSPEGKLLWSVAPRADDFSGTAVVGADGSVYVAADSVGLYALGSGGCIRWIFEKSGTRDTKTTPAVGADGTLYFGIDDAVVAVDPDGTEQWRYPLGDVEHLSPLIGADGTIYAVTADAVTALSVGGALKWTVPGVEASTQFPPSLSADSQLYVPTFRGALRAFGAAGNALWSVNTQSGDAPVIDSNGVAYTSDSFCVVSAISKQGAVVWSQALVGDNLASCDGPVMGADGSLYFSSVSVGIIAVKGQ